MAKKRSENKRIAETQEKIDEVVGIMKNNVEYVLQRDSKLTDLEDRASALEYSSKTFQKHSTAIKKKM